MIRFIKITGIYDDEEEGFAFFDTITDRFLDFDGVQVFEDLKDFEVNYTENCGRDYFRLVDLIPETFNP